jgi:hypothetical protein
VRPGAGIRSPNEARISHRYGPTGPGDDTYNLNHPHTDDTKRDIARQSGTATAGRRDGTVPQTKTISGSYRDTPNPNGARNGAYSGTGTGKAARHYRKKNGPGDAKRRIAAHPNRALQGSVSLITRIR